MAVRLSPVMLLLLTLTVLVAIAVAGPAAAETPYKVVCYFESWAVYRPGSGRHDVEDIDSDLCTHHIYKYAGLDSANKIDSLDPVRDLYVNDGECAYFRFTAMKLKHHQIKTMISVGGWNEGSEKYSRLAASAKNRTVFVESVLDFLTKYNFDGLDVDWEYPTQRGGVPEDRENYILLLKDLSEALRPKRLLLSAAVSAGTGRQAIDSAYDLLEMANYLDFMNVMSFAYSGDWDPFIRHPAPLSLTQKDIEHGEPFVWFNVNYTMHYYLQRGVPGSQLMMGFPLYGNGFQLQDPSKHAPYDPASGPMDPCPYTREPGFCGYNELCECVFSQSGWTDVWDEEMQAVYSYNASNWIGWDDLAAVQLKLDYLKSIGVGGAMLSSIDTDDFRGLCGPKYPIASLIYTELNGPVPRS